MNQQSYPNLSQGQKQIINLVSHLRTPEEIEGVRKTIVRYLSKELDEELEKLWADGTLNDDKIEDFRNLHERTPYRAAKNINSEN